MIEQSPASTKALVVRWTQGLWNWLASRALPSPVFLSVQRSQWGDEQTISQWTVPICVKMGLLRWKNKIAGARLYLDGRDFGPPRESEGILLKWIVDGKLADETSLIAGKIYSTTIVVRDEREGTAYIANEQFVDTGGTAKEWALSPGRHGDMITDAIGRYTFWLEVRTEKSRWRSAHFYVVTVPPPGPGSNHSFLLMTLDDAPQYIGRAERGRRAY